MSKAFLANQYGGDIHASDISTDDNHLFVTSAEKSTWNNKQNALTFDDSPTQNSTNPVKSGGVYSAIAGKSTVSGTNDGTNWTAITIDGNTKSIPAASDGVKLYRHSVTGLTIPNYNLFFTSTRKEIYTTARQIFDDYTSGRITSPMMWNAQILFFTDDTISQFRYSYLKATSIQLVGTISMDQAVSDTLL